MPAMLLLTLILIVVVAFWVTANVLGVLLTLLIAGVVGALADSVVPGRLPYGWLGAILAGLFGSWLGTLLIGHVGPSLAGIPIVPALLGAVIIAVVANVLFKRSYRGRER
jgi:uncharacterized membrane protein YeaQ/YmgE (transglycosylase-associated protein family)